MKSGKLRAIAYAGAKRSPILPDIPTFAEAGADFENTSWFALMAPAGTPKPFIGRIHDEVSRIIQEPGFNQQWLVSRGLDAGGESPEQLAEVIRAELPYWARIIKTAGVRLE